MTKITFSLRSVYNVLLAEYEGRPFGSKEFKELEQYIPKIEKKWREIKSPVLSFLSKAVKVKWEQKEIICYIVKYLKYSGISHPLTVRADADVDYAINVLIHELIHVLMASAPQKWKRVYRKLEKEFPEEKPRIISHLFVHFIQLQAIRKFFTKHQVKMIIKREKKYKIGRSWEIVLKKEKELKELFNEEANI